MKMYVPFLKNVSLLLVLVSLFATTSAQQITVVPELVFKNAKLISGQSNQDGAVYRFTGVATGIDANVTIVGRSSTKVVLDTIDIPPAGGNGFDKSLQPQLGIPGNTPTNSKWWMKFKLDFLKAGTTTPVTIDQFAVSALDIDGDGVSVAENVQMDSAASATYATNTLLTHPVAVPLACPKDGKLSLSIPCLNCLGLGYTLNNNKTQMCSNCKGSGYVFALCNHPWVGSSLFAQGPVRTSTAIDTAALQNIVTFTYANTSSLTFTYGATSGAQSSTAGERLNSLWFKSFNLKNTLLPVTLIDFSALNKTSSVKLNWSTSQEVNFSHFTVQRSTDGKDYSDYAVVFGVENPVTVNNYSYEDTDPESPSNTLYYRLKMVDNSEAITYSSVRIINLSQSNVKTYTLSPYPNPSADKVFLTLPSPWQGGKVIGNVTNMNGITVKAIQISNAGQTEQLDVTDLKKGFYIINLTSQGLTVQSKMIKN